MSAGQKGRKLAAALSLKPNQAFMCPRKGGVAEEDEWQGKRWSQAVLIAHYLVANKPPSYILTLMLEHKERAVLFLFSVNKNE